MDKVQCSRCEKVATEGSLKHPYCREHFERLFGNDYDKYFRFLETIHAN